MIVILHLRTKMKQSQFKNLIETLGKDLDILPDVLPVRDVPIIEEQILNKKMFLQYDPATHGGSYKLYEHYMQHKDLKWIWCHSGDRYGADPVELYNKAPDRCPVYGTLLDYGLGNNASTNHPLFRPSIDHDEQQSRGGTKRNDINNLEVMSLQANTHRNNQTLMHMMYLLKYELTKQS